MLAYTLRTLPIVARALAAGVDGRLVSVVHRRVTPGQIDYLRHMNQAVYAQMFELARTDWVMRSGCWKHLEANGVHAVVANQKITYRRELRLFMRYRMDARAVGVDGRLLTLDHYMLVGDRVHARCELQLLFVGPDGVLGADQVQELVGSYVTEPLHIEDWRLAA